MLAFLSWATVVAIAGCGGTVETPATDAALDSSADTGTIVADAAVDSGLPETTPIDSGASDIVISSIRFSAYEGKLVHFVITSRFDLSRIAEQTARVSMGKVNLRIASAMPRDMFGVGLDVYVDLLENEVCDGDDPVWQTIITNDFSKSEIDYAFDPAMATKIACDGIGK